MLRMKIFFHFFNLFKIFVSIMKSTSSVVTYLIFEFFIPAVCIVQIVYENALLFSLEY